MQTWNGKAQKAHCGWCGEIVGHRRPGELPMVARIGHMREKHPIQHVVDHVLAPFHGGDMLSFPIVWEDEREERGA